MFKYLIKLIKLFHKKKEPEKSLFSELPSVPLKEELDRPVWKKMSLRN